MVFFGIEIKFIMKKFWPHRSEAKGFLTEILASKYLEKCPSLSSHENSNQLLAHVDLRSEKEDCNPKAISQENNKKGHWANRAFLEYKDVA